MKKEKLLKYAEKLNIDPKQIKKKQFLYSFIGFSFSIILYYFLQNLLIAVLVLTIFLYFSYNETGRIKAKVMQNERYNTEEFANFLSYSIILLQNGFNVYQTLELSKDYVGESFEKLISTLLSQIDDDKTLLPFSQFAENFNSNVIMQLSVMLYQLQTNGYDAKYLEKFPTILEKMRMSNIECRLKKRKESFSIYTLLPIIGLVAMVFIMIFNILGSFLGGDYV